MRAKKVSLRLQQVRRQSCRTVSVIKGQRRRERGRRYAILDRVDDTAPPGSLVVVQRLAEEIVEQQIGEPRILIVRLLDLAEEAAADDATAAPHQGDPAEVQIPALLLRCFAQKHVALRVGDHLRAVKSPPYILDEGLAVLLRRAFRSGQDAGGGDTLVFHGGETAREYRFSNQRHRR